MKDFKNYTAIDFLNDDSFINWLRFKGNQNANSLFWKDFFENNIEKQSEIEKAILMYRELDTHEDIDDDIQVKVWERIQGSIIVKNNDLNRKTSLWSIPLKIAASIVLIIGLGTAYYFGNTQFKQNEYEKDLVVLTNKKNHATTVLLADGSSVVLGSNSTISYPKKIFGKNRIVKLNGKAFFEIAKDKNKPFIIYSKNMTTKVVGTSFVLEDFSTTSQADISVVTGVVSVFSSDDSRKNIEDDNAKGQTLTEKESIRFDNMTNSFRLTDYEEHISSTFTFIDAPVLKVIEVLEDFYGIDIQLDRDKVKNCALNAKLIDMPLEGKIDLICKALGYNYTINNNLVTLQGDGCL